MKGFSNHPQTFPHQLLQDRRMRMNTSVSITVQEKLVISFSEGQLAPCILNQTKGHSAAKIKMQRCNATFKHFFSAMCKVAAP